MTGQLPLVEFHDRDDGVIVTSMRDAITYLTSADNLVPYDSSRPIYHGLLMNRQQIQQIIDNKHLFDTGLVNAAYLLVSVTDNVDIRVE